jgi:hypothetical protein
MKLIKWAYKHNVGKLRVDGIEIEFASREPERPFFSEKPWKTETTQIAPKAVEPVAASESTQKAMAALRSKLDDPDVFAHESDAWANQTRLPRT